METYYMLFAWVVIIAVFYFLMIRPQRKKEKEHEAMVSAVAVGDSILWCCHRHDRRCRDR